MMLQQPGRFGVGGGGGGGRLNASGCDHLCGGEKNKGTKGKALGR